jgi:hypothetical protein
VERPRPLIRKVTQMSIHINSAEDIVESLDDFDEDATTKRLREQKDEIEEDIGEIENLIGELRDALSERRRRVQEIEVELNGRDEEDEDEAA